MDNEQRQRLVEEARRMFETSRLGALGHVDRDMLQALLQTIDEAPQGGVWGSFTAGGWLECADAAEARWVTEEAFGYWIERPRHAVVEDQLKDLRYGRFYPAGLVVEEPRPPEGTTVYKLVHLGKNG
jgi:hypothetical protein